MKKMLLIMGVLVAFLLPVELFGCDDNSELQTEIAGRNEEDVPFYA